MKLPGVATVDFDVEPTDDRHSRLTQTARFQPKGLFGIIYWYGVVPLHGIVFAGMLGGIRAAAEAAASADRGGAAEPRFSHRGESGLAASRPERGSP